MDNPKIVFTAYEDDPEIVETICTNHPNSDTEIRVEGRALVGRLTNDVGPAINILLDWERFTYDTSTSVLSVNSDTNTILYGVDDPSDIEGTDGDFYINVSIHYIYGPKAGGTWPAGASLIGEPGTNGIDGNTILYGTSTPTSEVGVDGNFYINSTTHYIYGPKAAGVWPAGTSLVGPAGADGDDGTNGTNGIDGNTILYGTGAPSSGLGVNGNFYISTDTHYIYGPKAAGVWPAGTSLVGPAGATFTDRVSPLWYGAVGDGVTNDLTALNAMVATGYPVDWGGIGKVYRITGTLNITASKDVDWQAQGASLILDASPVRRCIDLDCNGYNVKIEGLAIDADDNAFQGLFIDNSVTSAKPTVVIDQVSVKNCYRSSTAYAGGDGIFVDGGYTIVNVKRCIIDTVKMAVDAGIAGSQGVSGITIARNLTSLEDADTVIVEGNRVSNIFSEDSTYGYDQDGFKVFQNYSDAATISHPKLAVVKDNYTYNCLGRSVKLQVEHGIIKDHFSFRDGTIHGTDWYGLNPDFDFQVGAGSAENIHCSYVGNFPKTSINCTYGRVDARVQPCLFKVDGLFVQQGSSGTGIERLIALVSAYASSYDNVYFADISNVYCAGAKAPTYFVYISSLDTDQKFFIHARSCIARASSAVFYRAGATCPVYATGTNIKKLGSGSIPFLTGSSTSSLYDSLLGQNSLVT